MTSILSDIERILKSNHSIGLFVSGGLDSAVLSYAVHYIRKKLNTDNHIEFFTVPRHDDSVIHAKRIISFIDSSFNLPESKLTIVGNPDLFHGEQVLSGLRDALKINTVDILLLGDTKNPDHMPNGPLSPKSTNPKIYQPLLDYNKDSTVKLCIEIDALDLINLSHTCTESKLLRCNECWQCQERAWAFGQCNIKDTGTM